jgi:hypothetical protein
MILLAAGTVEETNAGADAPLYIKSAFSADGGHLRVETNRFCVPR